MSSQQFPINHPTQKQIAQAIVDNLVIDCSFPLSVVEHASFKMFMKVVEPRFTPISRYVSMCRQGGGGKVYEEPGSI